MVQRRPRGAFGPCAAAGRRDDPSGPEARIGPVLGLHRHLPLALLLSACSQAPIGLGSPQDPSSFRATAELLAHDRSCGIGRVTDEQRLIRLTVAIGVDAVF